GRTAPAHHWLDLAPRRGSRGRLRCLPGEAGGAQVTLLGFVAGKRKRAPYGALCQICAGGLRLASGTRCRLSQFRGVLRRAQPDGAWLLDEGRAWQAECAGELEEQTQRGKASAGSQVLQLGRTDAGDYRQALQ